MDEKLKHKIIKVESFAPKQKTTYGRYVQSTPSTTDLQARKAQKALHRKLLTRINRPGNLFLIWYGFALSARLFG